MEASIPSFRLKRRYNNLVVFGFLVYSASVDETDWNLFVSLSDIKSVENISFTYHAAAAEVKPPPVEFVPFLPVSLDAITVSKENGNICTLPYEYFHNVTSDKTTRHKMDVYILDTGIQSTHTAFEGRVTHGFDAFNSPPLRSDPHGHGTQVAGIIGGREYGVNSEVTMIDVRVINPNGVARADDIIAGLDYSIGAHLRKRDSDPLTSVINLSLTGPQSKILEFALYLTSKVMLVIASNGDENSFSCWKSPSSSEFILSVGGIENDTNTQLHDSNYGDCVDIWAPGANIPTSYIGKSNKETKPLTGSSAAAAIVTGIATRFLGIIERNSTIKEALLSLHKETTISQFLKTTLTSSKRTFSNQTDTVHLNQYLSCDLSVIESMSEILSLELNLDNRKKIIPALTRAKKILMDLQQQQKAALFAD